MNPSLAILAAVLLLHPFFFDTGEKGVPVHSSHQSSQAEHNREPGSSHEFRGFDQLIPQLMRKWNLPGGAIAITKGERLVFAKGYGIADQESSQPVFADSLFRIASVSKSITAVAILKLCEEGKLELDAKVFRLLDQLKPLPKAKVDPRLYDISIRQLLYHSGGWDQRKSNDPMGQSREAARAFGLPLPVGAETIIRFMIGHRLDFDPGTRYAYSNLGYCVLGRVIEKVSGQSYQEYVREHVLKPAGITRMQIGRTLHSGRYPGEVTYYSAPGVSAGRSALSDDRKEVPIQYGSYFLESMDSHGGWIASAVDLVRFVASVDGQNGRPDVLKKETLDQMAARPQPPLWVGSPIYYSMGWNVRPVKRGAVWYHTGALAGSGLAAIVRTPGGLSWAVLFNSMPAKLSDVNPFFVEMDKAIGLAINQVKDWPAHDLFSEYS